MELSRFTRGFLPVGFLVGIDDGASSGCAAFLTVAVRALVDLVTAGIAVVGVFVLDEALVAAGFPDIVARV